MRLGNWQRVAIVLSVVWAVGAGISAHNEDVKSAENFAKFSYDVCARGKAVSQDTDLSSCDLERKMNLSTSMKGDAGNVAIEALLPIPLGWLAGFILLHICRAQIIGFRAVLPWAALNLYKRAFVVFCGVASLAVILFGVLVVMNLYVDTNVPVSLSPFFDVAKVGDNLVVVKGTWTRTDLTDDTIASPLQTSEIRCNKEERRCVEAKAYVSGNSLFSEIVEYDIESWTPAGIALRHDELCYTEVFTIDLNTKAVSGAGRRINKDDTYCKVYGAGRETWGYQLSRGFKVYWEERQKARPLALKVIQALFGH